MCGLCVQFRDIIYIYLPLSICMHADKYHLTTNMADTRYDVCVQLLQMQTETCTPSVTWQGRHNARHVCMDNCHVTFWNAAPCDPTQHYLVWRRDQHSAPYVLHTQGACMSTQTLRNCVCKIWHIDWLLPGSSNTRGQIRSCTHDNFILGRAFTWTQTDINGCGLNKEMGVWG